MRILKDNKIRLEKNERRVGNFVLKEEAEHMKICDIGGLFTHRAYKATPVGMFLKQSFDKLGSDEPTGRGLKNWIAVIFTVFATIPDMDFLNETYAAADACMHRHPEAYGAPISAGTEEENAEVEQEMREMMEFEKGMADLPDDAAASE